MEYTFSSFFCKIRGLKIQFHYLWTFFVMLYDIHYWSLKVADHFIILYFIIFKPLSSLLKQNLIIRLYEMINTIPDEKVQFRVIKSLFQEVRMDIGLLFGNLRGCFRSLWVKICEAIIFEWSFSFFFPTFFFLKF